VDAIRAVERGEAPLQPSVAAKLLAHLHYAPTSESPGASPAGLPSSGTTVSVQEASGLLVNDLTEREYEILRLVARGENNREIGEGLYITEGTVTNHVSSILSKLGLRDRTQAALWAREHGLA
jgi:DNA-binding NarL/FixJ family response regulator